MPCDLSRFIIPWIWHRLGLFSALEEAEVEDNRTRAHSINSARAVVGMGVLDSRTRVHSINSARVVEEVEVSDSRTRAHSINSARVVEEMEVNTAEDVTIALL